MKEHKDFVVAVIVAICIPVLFGLFYLYKMENTRGANDFIAKLETRKELYLFGSSDLKNIKEQVYQSDEYQSSAYEEFEIDYVSGLDDKIVYTIKLRDINLGKKVSGKSISWKLVRQDEDGNFALVNNGSFDSLDDQVAIGNYIIAKGETQRYKIYYYFNEKVVDESFFAKVVIE